MAKTLIVSNRLPVFLEKEQEVWKLQPSPGGVATGLRSLPLAQEQLWIGWPGVAADALSEADKAGVDKQLAAQHCLGVHLSKAQVERFYEGFCNKTIWPLFHYFTQYAAYDKTLWDAYQEANLIFAKAILQGATPQDTIWIHDYQLMLVPQMVREGMPEARVGFFLHIPFPSWEIFRLLPWRTELLRGLLGADLVGFHTYDYARHFLSTASKLLGVEHTLGRLTLGSRMVKADAFPMSINYQVYSQAPSEPAVKKEIQAVSKAVAGARLMISIDRLDYTKGILQRVEAFDAFLSQYPQYLGKVKLLLLAVPSRSGVADYAALREQVERLVGRVNGQYGSVEWTPIQYLYRAAPFEELCAFYAAADIALVTPVRDGMNLIAKEFIATRTDASGVLILSEFAGAASELGEAIIVNANDRQAVVDAIRQALDMPLEEQQRRNRMMQRRLRRYDIFRWARDFMQALDDTIEAAKSLQMVRFAHGDFDAMKDAFAGSSKRLFLLDYDGTLLGFASRPEEAVPDKELIGLLERLIADERNSVVILSGRDRGTLEKWLGNLGAGLVAEHGAWRRDKGGAWRAAEGLRGDWKETVKSVLDLYADRTPGAIVEEKEFSLVWHYRMADLVMARTRLAELKAAIMHLTQNQNLGIFEGNRILEVRSLSVNKGTTAQAIVGEGGWDFILAAGDDYTDEDMFRALPARAQSFKIGYGGSAARFSVGGVRQFRSILEELAGSEYAAHR
jgi:trehalose 6-phosphate synthase/phosphatase